VKLSVECRMSTRGTNEEFYLTSTGSNQWTKSEVSTCGRFSCARNMPLTKANNETPRVRRRGIVGSLSKERGSAGVVSNDRKRSEENAYEIVFTALWPRPGRAGAALLLLVCSGLAFVGRQHGSYHSTDLPPETASSAQSVTPEQEKETPVQPRSHVARKKPVKPLCRECLEIVQRAPPMDISFVNVSDGFKQHPHKGALDVDGNPFVPDETALRRHPPLLNLSNDELREQCNRHDDDHAMITKKVSIDMAGEKEAVESGRRRDKIFCLAYTVSPYHSRIPPIRETWGCVSRMVTEWPNLPI
jgi:hypothetical protein